MRTIPNNRFVFRRIRLKRYSIYAAPNGYIEVTGYVRKKRKTYKPPTEVGNPLPEGSQVIVSKDGCFIFRDGADYWTCPLTTNERKLVTAVAATDGYRLDGDLAFETLWPKKNTIDEKRFHKNSLRDVIGHINRKLQSRKIPVFIAFRDGYVTIMDLTKGN